MLWWEHLFKITRCFKYSRPSELLTKRKTVLSPTRNLRTFSSFSTRSNSVGTMWNLSWDNFLLSQIGFWLTTPSLKKPSLRSSKNMRTRIPQVSRVLRSRTMIEIMDGARQTLLLEDMLAFGLMNASLQLLMLYMAMISLEIQLRVSSIRNLLAISTYVPQPEIKIKRAQKLVETMRAYSEVNLVAQVCYVAQHDKARSITESLADVLVKPSS